MEEQRFTLGRNRTIPRDVHNFWSRHGDTVVVDATLLLIFRDCSQRMMSQDAFPSRFGLVWNIW